MRAGWVVPELKEAILEELRGVIVNFDINNIKSLAQNALDKGISPYEIIMSGMTKGMEIVGQKFQDGEYFLPELMMASETFREGMKILGPHVKVSDIGSQGRIVIGTVEGDLHDIGKNLVKYMLEGSGFEVNDLGIDVAADSFLTKAREISADIIAMSALLSTTVPNMRKAVDVIRRAQIGAKVLVGGAAVDMVTGTLLGADGYAKDAIDGTKICKKWVFHRD
jgi:5-methyltetrahydrofolate--homocysteine methyltransferase